MTAKILLFPITGNDHVQSLLFEHELVTREVGRHVEMVPRETLCYEAPRRSVVPPVCHRMGWSDSGLSRLWAAVWGIK